MLLLVGDVDRQDDVHEGEGEEELDEQRRHRAGAGHVERTVPQRQRDHRDHGRDEGSAELRGPVGPEVHQREPVAQEGAEGHGRVEVTTGQVRAAHTLATRTAATATAETPAGADAVLRNVKTRKNAPRNSET